MRDKGKDSPIWKEVSENLSEKETVSKMRVNIDDI